MTPGSLIWIVAFIAWGFAPAPASSDEADSTIASSHGCLTCVASAAEPTPSKPPTTPPQRGTGVAIHEGQAGRILYTLRDGRLQEGQAGAILYTIRNDRVMKGQSGPTLFTVRDGKVHDGQSGPIRFTIKNGKVHEGQDGKVLFTISGTSLREGQGGRILNTWKGRLSDTEIALLVWLKMR